MEKIAQILDNVKERFTSPLIFSFIVSWIFCNWEVTIALLWYDPPANYQGHLSLIDFVQGHTNLENSFKYPLFLALGYTIIYPFIKVGISALQALTARIDEELNNKILKESKVSIEKFLAVRESFRKRKEDLEKVLDSEKQTLDQIDQLKAALVDERMKHGETKKELGDSKMIIGNHNNVSIISGKWIRKLKNDQKNEVQNIVVQNNNVYIHNGRSIEQMYSIQNFYFDIQTGRTCFTLFHFNQNSKSNFGFYSFNQLEYHHKQFTGMEYKLDGSGEISYESDE